MKRMKYLRINFIIELTNWLKFLIRNVLYVYEKFCGIEHSTVRMALDGHVGGRGAEAP